MITGKVKFFNVSKGFGFIVRDDRQADVFVHSSGVAHGVSLSDGMAVQFETEQSQKGLRAINVRAA